MGGATQPGNRLFAANLPPRLSVLRGAAYVPCMVASARVLTLGILIASVGCASADPGTDESDSDVSEGSGVGNTSTGATTTGTTQSTETAGDDAPMAGPSYRAVFVAGTPNELRILQTDDEARRCTWLVLTDDTLGWLAIATPSGWNARTAYTNEDPDACAEDPRAGGYSQVSRATGTVTATSEGTLAPCLLDVEASLEFGSESFTATFSTVGLAVEGCM